MTEEIKQTYNTDSLEKKIDALTRSMKGIKIAVWILVGWTIFRFISKLYLAFAP